MQNSLISAGKSCLSNQISILIIIIITMESSKLASRKKLLPHALRRLERKQLHITFSRIKKFAMLFQEQKILLSLNGHKKFSECIDQDSLEQKQKLHKIRQAMINLQLRQGETSLLNAFLVWRDLAIIQSKVAQKRDVVSFYES